MQEHRIDRDQLLAFQPVEAKSGSGSRIESGQFATKCVQPADGPAIVVLVVAGDQPGGEAIQPGRLERDGTGVERHRALVDDTLVSREKYRCPIGRAIGK